MVLYWKTLVLLNESVVFWIAGGCEAHPCVHIKMAGVHTRGFRNIPIYTYVTVRYETSLTLIQKSDNYGGPKNCIITDYIAPTTHLVKGPLSHLAT